MIFHVSIEADDPRQVAEAFAQIMGGEALPFPPVGVGSWAALAGDTFGSMVEVYPRGTVIREGAGSEGAYGASAEPRRNGPTHIAIGTNLEADEIFAIADRNGWVAKYCRREDRFGLIEVWIDGCFMVEVLTPQMQREYLDTVTIPNWKQMLKDFALRQAA